MSKDRCIIDRRYRGVGAWASFLSNRFYDSFPGGGRQWIAGDGPFNEHLVSDTGVGFLAVGVVAALAAAWLERRLVQAASARPSGSWRGFVPPGAVNSPFTAAASTDGHPLALTRASYPPRES